MQTINVLWTKLEKGLALVVLAGLFVMATSTDAYSQRRGMATKGEGNECISIGQIYTLDFVNTSNHTFVGVTAPGSLANGVSVFLSTGSVAPGQTFSIAVQIPNNYTGSSVMIPLTLLFANGEGITETFYHCVKSAQND